MQSAPHIVTDVQAIGCDFLVCSAYKFFGPHQGILWGRREVLEQLEPYKVRPAPDSIPWCFAPGTASHEGMAGTAAALDYLAWVGTSMAGAPSERKPAMRAATEMLFAYEQQLSRHLVAGLHSLPGVTIRGITATDKNARRTFRVRMAAKLMTNSKMTRPKPIASWEKKRRTASTSEVTR